MQQVSYMQCPVLMQLSFFSISWGSAGNNLSFKTLLTPIARRVTFRHNSQRQDRWRLLLSNTHSLRNFKKLYNNESFNERPKAVEKEPPPACPYHFHHLLFHAALKFSITNNVLFVHFHCILLMFSPGFIYKISQQSKKNFNHFNSSSLSSSYFFPLFALKSIRTQNLLVISCSTSLCLPGSFGSYFSTFMTYLRLVNLYLNALDSLDC